MNFKFNIHPCTEAGASFVSFDDLVSSSGIYHIVNDKMKVVKRPCEKKIAKTIAGIAGHL